MLPKFFPTVLIILDLCAAGVYCFGGDWGRTGYWVSAAAITFCATYGMH